MISISCADVNFKLKKSKTTKLWMSEIISLKQKKKGTVNIVFCSDEYLYNMNKQFLKHNTYTDIITFDYSEKHTISGELYISIDRVKENAQKFNKTFDDELRRVLIHGVLHLIGYKDKTKADEEKMRKEEDKALKLFNIIKA